MDSMAKVGTRVSSIILDGIILLIYEDIKAAPSHSVMVLAGSRMDLTSGGVAVTSTKMDSC